MTLEPEYIDWDTPLDQTTSKVDYEGRAAPGDGDSFSQALVVACSIVWGVVAILIILAAVIG